MLGDKRAQGVMPETVVLEDRIQLDAAAWHATTLTTNRQRLLDGTIAGQFLARNVAQTDAAWLPSREHCCQATSEIPQVHGVTHKAWTSRGR
jgi:hypothetical protein